MSLCQADQGKISKISDHQKTHMLITVGGKKSSVNPYPTTIFALKIVSAFYICCIYSGALKIRFLHGSI